MLNTNHDPHPLRRIEYPIAPKDDKQVENRAGVTISDPFRPLENLANPETNAWIDAQNALTAELLHNHPAYAHFCRRLSAIFDYTTVSAPQRFGDKYFFTRHTYPQNFGVLCWSHSPGGSATPLIDPNQLSTDGTVAVTVTSVSQDGRFVAYGISKAGSDWKKIRVRETDSKRDLVDVVKYVKWGNIAWDHGANGFFYGRYPAPEPGKEMVGINANHKLYYHKLGTLQTEDRLICELPENPSFTFSPVVSHDGHFLIVHVFDGCAPFNWLYYKDLREDSPLKSLIVDNTAQYRFIANRAEKFYILTNSEAANWRVVEIDLNHPAPEQWREVIPAGPNYLEEVQFIAGKFVAHYLSNVSNLVRIYNEAGEREQDLKLPGIGAISLLAAQEEDRQAFFSFSSFTNPGAVYSYDFDTGKDSLHFAPIVSFTPADFVTSQVWYTSKDGTKIPMFIVHKKGIKTDGNNPVWLYGYGGFNVAETPVFLKNVMPWLEMGGIYAAPSLRGGSEFGEDWHRAGMLKNKQNVFDDFIAAAEYLISNGYTTPRKLAIGGSSNGGLLVAACMAQRPDLFGGATPDVGVMDMLRFHKFTNGKAWVPEYGDPEKDEDLRYLIKYSPLHNLKPGVHYPATLVTTSDHDDRVVPAHSYKFAARLQEVQGGAAPCLLWVDRSAGHGAATPLSKIIENRAARWTFLCWVMGLKVP